MATEAQYKTTYNISIVALEEAKGTLLAYDNIAVAEGPQPRKAYIQARDIQDAHRKLPDPATTARCTDPPVRPGQSRPGARQPAAGTSSPATSRPLPAPVGPLGPAADARCRRTVPAGEPPILSQKPAPAAPAGLGDRRPRGRPRPTASAQPAAATATPRPDRPGRPASMPANLGPGTARPAPALRLAQPPQRADPGPREPRPRSGDELPDRCPTEIDLPPLPPTSPDPASLRPSEPALAFRPTRAIVKTLLTIGPA